MQRLDVRDVDVCVTATRADGGLYDDGAIFVTTISWNAFPAAFAVVTLAPRGRDARPAELLEDHTFVVHPVDRRLVRGARAGKSVKALVSRPYVA